MTGPQLTRRSQELADQPPEDRPKCVPNCYWLLVGDHLWRCERCLRYMNATFKQAELF